MLVAREGGSVVSAGRVSLRGDFRTRLPGGLRKEPLQERSRAAIRNVLDVAAELVVEYGAEALIGSPTILLERSGISRGSFYAFFETPNRVLDELALQCMQNSREEILAMLAARRSRKWSGVIDTLIEQYWNQFHIPLVRELWVGQHLTSNIRTLDRVWGEELAEILLHEFGRFAPKFERLTIIQCVVAVEIMERLSQFAFRDDPDGDREVKAEIRCVLHGYFAVFE